MVSLTGRDHSWGREQTLRHKTEAKPQVSHRRRHTSSFKPRGGQMGAAMRQWPGADSPGTKARSP